MKHATLRQLRIFEASARHLSFTRAADELHLTQPAVSMQIKQIETHAGVALFEQIGKKIFLTQAGHAVRRLALEILSQVKDCEDELASIRGVKGGQLVLAVVSTAKYFAPHLLSAFSRSHPGVSIKLSVSNREQVIEQLQENQVDLAIMGQPPTGMDVVGSVFARHPSGIIAAPDHLLAKRRRIQLEQLAGETFLIREAGSGTRISMEKIFEAHGLYPTNVMELASNETIKQAVMAGMGISYLSLHTVGLELQTQKLVRLDVLNTPVMREWYVIQRIGKKLSPVAMAFRSFLVDKGAKLIEKTTRVMA